MRRLTIAGWLLLAAAGGAMAYSTGPLDGYAGNPPNNNNCTACHTSYALNSPGAEFFFSDGMGETYEPGETYELTLSLYRANRSRWGFELTVLDNANHMAGTLGVTDATNTQLSNNAGNSPDYLKHTSTGTYWGETDGAEWSFEWTAPDEGTGPVTFYAAGNQANGNGNNQSDYINTISVTLEEAAQGPVTVTFEPQDPPVVIPAGGGVFLFDASVTNNTPITRSGQAWINATLPNGNVFTIPLIIPITVGAGQTVSQEEVQQFVPGMAPAGQYNLTLNVGLYPAFIAGSASFGLMKQAGAMADNHNEGWNTYGWRGESSEAGVDLSLTPKDYLFENACPNPFNPATTITIGLPESADLNVAVYNMNGRLVAELANSFTTAGYHHFTFDGNNLASGIYFIHAVVPGRMDEMRKVILMK